MLNVTFVMQMCILDGNAYDAKCLEAGQERDEDLDACSLLVNNKMQPLLSPSGAASHNPQSKVVVQLTVRISCFLTLKRTNTQEKQTSLGSYISGRMLSIISKAPSDGTVRKVTSVTIGHFPCLCVVCASLNLLRSATYRETSFEVF